MLISLIVPIYNVEEYIEDCLISVIEQSYAGPIECILINDSTLDRSWTIAQEFVDNYLGRVRFVLKSHDSNLGLSAARNTGLSLAKGDYVLFVDSDDKLDQDALEKLVAPLSNMYYDFVIGSYLTIPENKITIFPSNEETTTHEIIKQSYVSGYWYPMAWNKLCNRKFLIENQLLFREGLIHEDELWSFQLADKANSMYQINRVTYKYRQREDSIMNSVSNNLELKFKRKIILYEQINIYIANKESKDIMDFYFLDKIVTNILNDIYHYKDKIPVKHLYKSLHSRYTLPLRNMFLGGFVILKQCIRNIHFYLPCSVGYVYWFSYRRLHEKFRLSISNLLRNNVI